MVRLVERSKNPLQNYGNKVLKGTFAELDTLNQNGRIYSKDVYTEALAEVQPKIKARQFIGELDHPDYDEVRLQNASHVVRECRIDGDRVYGEVEILDTPAGKIVQALMEAGIPIGISSRAFGDVTEANGQERVTNLQLITYDIVADPSFSNAILTESTKRDINNKLNEIKKNIPLRESKSSRDICKTISKIQEGYKLNEINQNKELIERLGEQTIQERKSKDLSSKLIIRNQSLQENMHALQDKYNKLCDDLCKISEQYELAHDDLIHLRESHDKNLKSLREKTRQIPKLKGEVDQLEEELAQMSEASQRLSENCQLQVLALQKELAIERRGLSKNKVMPLLEGAKTEGEIEHVLDTLDSLGGKRSQGYSDKALKSLTENSKQTTMSEGMRNLADLISKV